MKKILLLLTAAATVCSLTGCGSDETAALRSEVAELRERVAVLEMQVEELKQAPAVTVPAETEEQIPALSEEHQLIVDVVKAVLDSDIIAQCWKDYADMMGGTARDPEITDVIRYQIGDFEGEKMDCWLINIATDIGMADRNMVTNNFQVFVDITTGAYFDSLTVDAIGYAGGSLDDLQGKATYLLWGYGNAMNTPGGASSLLNSSEIITDMSHEDIDAINSYLEQ